MTIKELKDMLECSISPIVVIGIEFDGKRIQYNSFRDFYEDKSIDEFHLIEKEAVAIRNLIYIWVEEL